MDIKLRDKGGSVKRRIVALATAVTLSGAAAFVPVIAVADHTTAHTIEQLTAQIAALQAQLAALAGGTAPGAVSGAVNCNFTRNLFQGVSGDDVKCLQQYLNSAGFTLAASGAGSPGNETTFFGPITRAAVIKWQNSNSASVLAPLGLSAGTGFWGPSSRSHYDTLIAAAPPPAPAPAPTPPGEPPPPATVATGVTVTAATEQPAAALAVENAARMPYTKVVFTASADGDVTVKSITVERQGVADDSAFSSVMLVDENNEQIGLTRTLNALHQANLNEAFVVKAGTSRTMTIAANMDTDLDGEAGQVAKLAVVAVDAGTTTVNGTFPIAGNGMTINGTLAIGSLASPARGVLDPGAARTALEVGTTNFYASGVRWTVGSAEPVLLEQIRWNQAGSAASGDIKNIKVTAKDVDYDTTLSSDGKFYVAKFDPPIEYGKGDPVDLALKLDVESGSNRTLDFDILRRTDIVVKGKTFGYYLTAANGTSDPTDDSGSFANNEPYYDAFEHTISKGSLRLEKSNTVAAGNVPVDISAVELGAFNLDAKGEPVQISSFKLTFSLSAGEDGTQVDNVGIYDANGAVVAGPKDVGSDETVTFTDTWTVPVGLQTYIIKGKLTTDFEDGDTVQASTTASSDITAKGETTGLSITPTPGVVAANQMTVRRAALKVTVAPTPAAQNVVRSVNGFHFSTIQYDAGASGENLRITKQELTMTTSGSADMDDLNTCQMFDGATALNTGSNVVNPSGNAVGADAEASFAFDTHLIVPKGTVKNVDVKCNISGNFANGETISIGIADTNDDTVVVGADTGTSVTETVTTNVGSTMTVRDKGSFTVVLDTSSPSERLVFAGKTDKTAAVFKLESTYEPIRVTKFGFVLATSTASTSDIAKVTFWDGATKVGEGFFSGTDYTATSTFGGSFGEFIIPKDSSKILTAKVDLVDPLNLFGKPNLGGADSGHLIKINHDGSRTKATEGIGQNSGSTLNTSATSHTDSRGVRVVKTYPTLDRLSVPTNTLSSNSEFVLYRFSVKAPAEGGVGLYMTRFKVSSAVPMSATTSRFRLFAYSDSSFSSAAFATNPVNSNDVDCVGSSSLEQGANDTCSSNDNATNATYTDHSASTSAVTITFDPSKNNSTEPTSEAINVPANSTYYFELRANVSATTTDTISVSLLGDTQFRGALQREKTATLTGVDTLDIAETVATSSNFVWSPNTTSTSATTTNDWLTGYLLPGLPSTEMGAQTFSK